MMLSRLSVASSRPCNTQVLAAPLSSSPRSDRLNSHRSVPGRGDSHVVRRRKDSFMIEVNLGEEEPEDIAVRRYMKAVMESKVLEVLRWRKTKETKIEAYKRRMRERHEIRKLNIVEPAWEDMNPEEAGRAKAFDEFFTLDPEGEFGLPQDMNFFGGYSNGAESGGMWGGYMDQGVQQGGRGGSWDQGGYMDQMGVGQTSYSSLPAEQGSGGYSLPEQTFSFPSTPAQ